jgi:hypothetical protein
MYREALNLILKLLRKSATESEVNQAIKKRSGAYSEINNQKGYYIIREEGY